MANIDVTEVLLDMDFINSLQLIHRTTTVNSMGENVVTEDAPLDTVGSIQPLPQKDILRLPESMRLKDVRGFWIKAPILSDGSSLYPDIIVYGTKRFQVFATENWLNYGQGWNKGICVAEELS